MKYYPICLDISEKPCLVVGGGEVAARKTLRLLECGATVKVVAGEINAMLREMAAAGRISHLADNYDERCLAGAFLVIGATDRAEVNDRIAADCRARGILVNIVDDPQRCDFILPALLARGSLSIAVATDGKSPALAKKLRRELAGRFGPEYAPYVELLGRLRELIVGVGRPADENRDVFTALVNSPLLDLLRAGHREEAQALIRDLTDLEVETNFVDGPEIEMNPVPNPEAKTSP